MSRSAADVAVELYTELQATREALDRAVRLLVPPQVKGVTMTRTGGYCGDAPKRCYMPYTLAGRCECGAEWETDLAEDYLTDAEWDTPVDVRGECDECGREWSVRVVPRLTLEFAPEEP
jgi:hypothetical protein